MAIAPRPRNSLRPGSNCSFDRDGICDLGIEIEKKEAKPMKTNYDHFRTATNGVPDKRHTELYPEGQSLNERLLSSSERIFERKAVEGLRYWVKIFGYNEIIPPENDLDGGRFFLDKAGVF